MKTLDRLKNQLDAGHVYRRADLTRWSKAVDRHLKELLDEGALQRMSQGLYYCPKRASFGEVPPSDEELVRAFLKTTDFLLASYSDYNALGVGTTQLYNHCVVYNHKRHGQFELGGKMFDFRLKHKFPQTMTREFLLVDLLNNLSDLAEDKEAVLEAVGRKYFSPPTAQVQAMVNEYAGERTKRMLHDRFPAELSAQA
jgi:hypothetical protein